MMRHVWQRACRAVVPLMLVVMAALAVPAPLEANAPVRCVLATAGGQSVGEVHVNDQVVVRLRSSAGGMSPARRCEIVSARVAELMRQGALQDPRPGVAAGHVVVASGGDVLVTVLPEAAHSNGTSPAVLAWIWANNLRQALGMAPLPLSEAPYEGLAGVRRARVSWYGRGFEGRRTASGEPFDPDALTAAHRWLPFGSLVRVISPWSGAQVIVRINDRGPWSHGREFDLSLAAARQLGIVGMGVADVLVEVLHPAESR